MKTRFATSSFSIQPGSMALLRKIAQTDRRSVSATIEVLASEEGKRRGWIDENGKRKSKQSLPLPAGTA